MDISCSSKSILWQSAICVAVLTMLYVVALSDEDVCTVPDSTCNCSSPLTSRPPRPSFAECSVGELPEHLTSLINVTCETNANVSCNTVCMFKCDAGYTITHNESIICKIGRFTPDIPSCNETNECDSNPCQNNGTCYDLIDDYNCTCVPGYEGKNCENTTVPSTGTSASNPPTESTSSPSPTPSPTEPVTVPSTGTPASNPPTESTSSPSSTPSSTEPATVPFTGTSASNPPTASMSSPSPTPSSTEPATVSSTGTSASNPPTESTSSPSPTPSTTEPAIPCTVPMDAADSTCEGSVSPGKMCSFKCDGIGNSVLTATCETMGSLNKGLPKCGSFGSNAMGVMNVRRKRRETLPLDNQDVITVQETFESAILGLATTYLVNVTTISAQSLSNGQMQMNLLIGVMYMSDVTVESLIEQIEEALLAVNEFSVVSVDVTDLDALCSPTPCKNNGVCRVDYNTFDYTCVCASGYSGPQCSNSPNDVLLAILVPITILILLFIIFFVVLVVYYRVRLHKLEGYKKRPFHNDMKARQYEDGMHQLYFTEDRRYQHQDPVTFKNSAMGLRFSKEINARMQVRSQQMELQGHHPSSSQHDPAGRHRSRTNPIKSGRSLHDWPVTDDQGLQGHRPNGMRSQGNPSLSHETGNGSVVYNEAARRSVNDRNMVSLGRSRNGSMPSDVHVANGFHDTRL